MNDQYTASRGKASTAPVGKLGRPQFADPERRPLNRLVDILGYRRCHGSTTLTEFVERLILRPYPSAQLFSGRCQKTGAQEPAAVVITTDPSSRTLFSCHLDTVHEGGGYQGVHYDSASGVISCLPGQANPDVLGADDGAGIWLLLEMIDAGVPGTYTFTYGEERGRIGSRYLASDHTDFLRKFSRAIAFDSRDIDRVVTHQAGQPCCSPAFAQELALALNSHSDMLALQPSDKGTSTDTRCYTALIPECTNVSCGYFDAHTIDEYLDSYYLLELRLAALAIDWELLPTLRYIA